MRLCLCLNWTPRFRSLLLLIISSGLLIVRRIIREHGGEIEIQSQPDQGTNILIHLPHTAPSPRLLPSPTIDL